ncbi:alkylation response protein AidB-like acyl-CoA dehydrogenase [Arthrobacter sp. AG367]|uniref:acyl-CoA dehydrogenase family protein n=1 Tax=Arthrobacter sp. AG367 TaxID=2572909 RepID=UPI00119F97CA|nr:acyl-CoA dehydrogenase family protein [Arthrobacter sp. AG367]TWD48087.1 alkylation response protein AidB-like acyl-CoA dehydrogenase [Arthrobacter sp. AG367]
MAGAAIRPEIAAIVEKIDGLRPMLVAGGREADQNRRLPEEAFRAVAATGAFSISVPTKFGGLAANTREAHAVSRAIGRGDGSLAWVDGILDSGAWVLSLMDEQAQEDVWGTEGGLDSFISIVLATTSDAVQTEGGYRVTGKWGYGTGSMNATWSLLGIPIKNDKGEVVDAGLALIPTADLSYEDNWFVAGMKSTASVMQVAEDVFVPSHRVFPLTAAVDGGYLSDHHEASYKTVFVPSLFMKLIGPHLGMGRAALDFVIAKAETKAIAYTGYEKQADSALFQAAVAKASVQLDAAEALAAQVADEIFEATARGYYAPYAERIEMRAKAGWIVETITNTINDLITAHGSAGFAETSALQRIWRDQATAARHGHTLTASGYEAFGKVLCSREEDARFVLPIV